MERPFIVFAVLITCMFIAPSAAQVTGTVPIGKIISEWEQLRELKAWMTGTPFFSTLSIDPPATFDGRYTFFAPINSALKNISRLYRQRLLDPNQRARSERQDVLKSHAIFKFDGTTFTTSNIKNVSERTMAPGTPTAFFMNIYQEYYMNGARLVMKDIKCSNGVLHLIDTLVYPVPRSENAVYFIGKNAVPSAPTLKITKFSDLLQKNTIYEHPRAGMEINLREMVTIFVPQDSAFTDMPAFAQVNLAQNKLLLKGVLENHIIPQKVFHTSLLERATVPIPGLNEPIRTIRIGNDLFVSNIGTCVQAKITHPNITVANGVVHIIDKYLGYQYADLSTEIRQNELLRRFSKHMLDGPQDVQSKLTVSKQDEATGNFNKDTTVFAPADLAFQNLENVIDLTQNAEALNEVMRIHTIPRRIEAQEMQNTTRPIKTMLSTYSVTFRRYGKYGQDIFVEVNHVRAKIIRPNVCTKNGLIHIIDTVLGRAFRTVYQEVDANDLTVAYARMVRDTTLRQNYDDRKRIVTIFAFTDVAVEELRATSDFGRRILQTPNMQKLLLESFEISGRQYLDALGDGTTTLKSIHGTDVVITKNGEIYHVTFAGKTAKVLRADIKATNGVVHIMDKVLFSDNPRSSQWVGGACSLTPSFSLLTLTVGLMQMCFRGH